MHDEEGDHGGERRDLFLRFCHADGDADSEDDRQIAEDCAACTRHDREQCVQWCSCAEHSAETVCRDGRWVRERRADAEQDARDRQDRDRQHKAAPDALEHTKDFIFHSISPFSPSPPRTSSPLDAQCQSSRCTDTMKTVLMK